MLIYKTEYFGNPVELTFKVEGGEIRITHVSGSKVVVDKIHKRQYDEWSEEIDNALSEEMPGEVRKYSEESEDDDQEDE
jgi:hypothetical protein